jgi:ABC-type polysaccharide/polyol phosphate transport system ATPase subunit
VWRIAMHERLSALIEAGAGFHHDLHGGKTFTSAALFIMGMRCEEIRRKFDVIVEFSGLADFTDCAAVLSSLGALTILPSP